MSSLFDIFWIFLILVSLQRVLQRRLLGQTRRRSLGRIAQERGSAVLTLIHRQETAPLLGIPLMRYVDLDDPERVSRDIRATPKGTPIDIAASQIAQALAEHDGPVRAIIPHYAMSGGTLVALAADQVKVDPHAALGPVDPQIGEYPAASIVAAVEQAKDPDDKTLILADQSRRALRQVEDTVRELLERRSEPGRAREVAHVLSSGVWTHDHPLNAVALQKLGMPVSAYDLMALYPQPRGVRTRSSTYPHVPAPQAGRRGR